MSLEHPALLYRDMEEFLARMVPFVTGGLESGEPVFMALGADEVAALRAEIDGDAPGLRLVDTKHWHPHPSNRLRAFHDYVTGELEAGASRVRLAGEPAWPAGPPEFVLEWERYESALNEALRSLPVTLVCAYDMSRLDPSIAESAGRTHPEIQDREDRTSGEFEDPPALLARRNGVAAPPPASASWLEPPIDISAARRFLLQRAAAAGLDAERAMDFSVAASEVLGNAVLHGGGPVGVSVWSEEGRLFCQVDDAGPGISDPLVGYRPPSVLRMHGRGLWLARQLVDLVQVFPRSPGATVRLQSWVSPRTR